MKKGLFILAALLCLIVTGALAEPEIIYEDETIVIKQDTVSRDKSVYHVLYVDIDSPEQLRSATAGEKGTKKTATVLSMAEQNNFAGCILNDVHREFSMLGQMGFDENGYGGGYYYRGRKNRYGRYDSYSKYSNYSDYKDITEENLPSDE